MSDYDEQTKQLAESLSSYTVTESAKLSQTISRLATSLADRIVSEAMTMAQRKTYEAPEKLSERHVEQEEDSSAVKIDY